MNTITSRWGLGFEPRALLKSSMYQLHLPHLSQRKLCSRAQNKEKSSQKIFKIKKKQKKQIKIISSQKLKG